MDKKYKLTDEMKEYNGKFLYRIEALRNFSNVKAGDLGGWVEGEHNLSHEGDCWVYDEAMVLDNVRIEDSAFASMYAIISENAKLQCFSAGTEYAKIFGNAKLSGRAFIYGNALIYGNAKILGNEKIGANANIKESNDFMCDNYFILYSDLTFYKTDSGIFVTLWGNQYSLNEYSLDKFEELVETKFNKSALERYKTLIEAAKLKIKL